jgi:site-specific DNA recombinase
VARIEADQIPGELARALFEALRLEIRYNRDTNRVTLTGPTITTAGRTAHDAAVISLDAARQRCQQRQLENTDQYRHPLGDDTVSILVVPPAGFEPALPPPEGGALSPELRGRLVGEA